MAGEIGMKVVAVTASQAKRTRATNQGSRNPAAAVAKSQAAVAKSQAAVDKSQAVVDKSRAVEARSPVAARSKRHNSLSSTRWFDPLPNFSLQPTRGRMLARA